MNILLILAVIVPWVLVIPAAWDGNPLGVVVLSVNALVVCWWEIRKLRGEFAKKDCELAEWRKLSNGDWANVESMRKGIIEVAHVNIEREKKAEKLP